MDLTAICLLLLKLAACLLLVGLLLRLFTGTLVLSRQDRLQLRQYLQALQAGRQIAKNEGTHYAGLRKDETIVRGSRYVYALAAVLALLGFAGLLWQ